METSRVNRLNVEISNLEYKEKLLLFKNCFGIGNFGSDLNDTLILISLVGLVTSKMKDKDPEITPLRVLLKITGIHDRTSSIYQMLENLSILVEDLTHDQMKIDACGFKNSQEIINKIKIILDQWLPF